MVKTEVKNPCIWMQAGVVAKKECLREYECQGCVFDQALFKTVLKNKQLLEKGERPAGKAGRIVFWQDKFMSLAPMQRPCVYFLKKKTGFRPCFEDYQCARCEFNQFFEDVYTVHTFLTPVDLLDVKGIKFPQGYYLHPGHLWLKVEQSSTVLIGLDEFVWKVFYPQEVKPPLLGKRLKQHAPGVEIFRDGYRSSLLSPVSGLVLEINSQVWNDPQPMVQEPYSEGWVLKVQADHLLPELGSLFLGDQSQNFLAKEIDVLFDELEEVGLPLAADGGTLAQDVYGQVEDVSWKRLDELFLRKKTV